MIVVRISGGLGNQMFQYAFARALQSRGQQVTLHWHTHHSKSAHNGFELHRVFDPDPTEQIPLASETLRTRWQAWRLRKSKRLREKKELQFQPHFLQMDQGYLDGYWQAPAYFTEISDSIEQAFRFQPIIGSKNQTLLSEINRKPSCSVHIRRGDYVNHPELDGICGEAYYEKALKELDSRYPECSLFVFSDDIHYCRKLLAGRPDIHYCDWNTGSDSWIDMALMAQCEHHIIANSSFSWWGAWLATPNGLTIAPKTWSLKFDTEIDICPTDWLSL